MIEYLPFIPYESNKPMTKQEYIDKYNKRQEKIPEIDLSNTYINTVGDLINFLSSFDKENKIELCISGSRGVIEELKVEAYGPNNKLILLCGIDYNLDSDQE